MDLTTRYMSLTLRNPLVASASPVNREIAVPRALEDHGAGAVVLPSVFEEQIAAERRELEARVHVPAIGFAEAQSYFPRYAEYGFGTQAYLDIARRAKESLEIPMIASLNCTTSAGWVDYARALQAVGADAVELNVYFIPSDPALDGRDVEQRHLDILAAVKAAVFIPVAVKIGPYFSATSGVARARAHAGADALVLFNRFYQPDIDIATLRFTSALELSTPAEIRLPLHWERAAARACRVLARGEHRCRIRRRGVQVSAGRGRRGHDPFRAAAPRRPAHAHAGGWIVARACRARR